ncbi:MAG: hypothetical protein HKN86_04260 [Acidimicrobiia bacterium]|nr:hypothetical protein [Acidimicrobiia bacterium]
MPKTLVSVPSFTAGQLSPRMEGRTDFQKYFSAGTTINNFIVQPHGPVARRPGTYFVSEVKDSSKDTRLIPFSFSTTQTYILEFGNQYIRFYKDSGQITSGGSAYEISSPYLEAELFDIKFAQSADVMYICHENHAVRKLSRTGHTSWSLTEVDFTDGPYLDSNISTTTLTTTNHTVGTGRTLTASSNIFVSTDVGRLVRFRDGYGKITGYTSATVVTWQVLKDTGSASTSTNWSLGAFSDTTGHPKCVSFFEQRLVFAGTTDQPQTLFFSQSGDYENMDDGLSGSVTDSSAMVYTIASNQVNAITSIKATRTLIVMTTGGEFTVTSGAAEDPVTPTNLNIRKQSSYGSAGVDALSIGNTTIFLQRAKRKIRELAYNFDNDGYIAPDLTILSENLTLSGLIQIDYQQEPYSVLWGVRTDGKLVGMTYNRIQDVVAWHEHDFGGTNAKCKSVAVIDIDTSEDQVWVVIERTINGSTKKYVEYLTPSDFNSNIEEFHYVDSGLAYNGSATTTLTGLDHLEGETVKIIANGATHPDKIVSSGSITLDRSVTNAKVGLGYNSILKTMRLDDGVGITDQTKTKRIYDVTVRFFETVGAKVGPDEDNLDIIPFRDSSAAMTAPVPLFTGDKETEFPSDYGTNGFVVVKQDQPLPTTILAIYARLEIYDT